MTTLPAFVNVLDQDDVRVLVEVEVSVLLNPAGEASRESRWAPMTVIRLAILRGQACRAVRTVEWSSIVYPYPSVILADSLSVRVTNESTSAAELNKVQY